MMNLPLACMGREVEFKLGASVGKVEEVDTNKDGVRWGEFLRVKINIDLYQPLSRGRMVKFDLKSTLIGFKYEHLPKFCFHCGVICHGVEGCLMQTKLRNQEMNQFGLWLRATSPTRKATKGFDRHAEQCNSSRFAKPVPVEELKQAGTHGKKEIGRKRRTTDGNGENSFASVSYRGNHNRWAKEFRSGNQGRNHEECDKAIFFESHMEKESNKFGTLRGKFEKLTTPCKEAWIPRNEGRNQAGDSAGGHVEKNSKNSKEKLPRDMGLAGQVTDSPT